MTAFALKLMKAKYMLPEEKTPEEAFRRAAKAWCRGDTALEDRITEYATKKWIAFSTPILSNAGRTGLPISCYLSYVGDSLKELIDSSEELCWMSVKGGGVGQHWSDVRSVSDKAPGPVPFIKTVDATITAYHQGGSRRGSAACYLDVSHPDFLEFLQLRLPSGDLGRKCLSIGFHHGVNLSNAFMGAVENDDEWQFIDPHDASVRATLPARRVWEMILETRMKTGEPYLCFIDTCNAKLPSGLWDRGQRVRGSNLCSEVILPTGPKKSAVCCLSSLNLAHWDEWKDTNLVHDMIRFLDNVMECFIEQAPPQLSKAVYAAKCERSLGLGALGYHTLLQKHGLPFDSEKAYELNKRIFKTIRDCADEASLQLLDERGPCLEGDGKVRNYHKLAIAPNANSSIIAEASASIEPINSNAYTHKTRVGSFLVKNPQLEHILEVQGMNTFETWKSIIDNGGSVQHLDFLSDYDKQIFLTAFEIDQMAIIKAAGDRQEFICQGQSVNLFFNHGVDRDYVSKVHFEAFTQGLKSLYYCRTKAAHYANIGKSEDREALQDGCEACQ